MEVHKNTPCLFNAPVCVAGCTNDGLVYTVAIGGIIHDFKEWWYSGMPEDWDTLNVSLWVHSGVQEKWRLLATLNIASTPHLGYRQCSMSAALTYDKNSVAVVLKLGHYGSYLIRFFVPYPKEDCVYKYIDGEQIQFDDIIGPVLHWLGDDSLLVAGRPRNEARFHIWRINVNKESKAFSLTDLLVYDLAYLHQHVTVCADEEFLYVLSMPPGKIKQHAKSHDGSVKLCNEMVFPIAQIDDKCGRILAYPSTDGQRLLVLINGHCYMYDCQLQSLQEMFTFDYRGREAYHFWCYANICTASSAQFFWLKQNGTIGQKRIGMPSLQYMCLQNLCATWPSLKECTDDKEAEKMGIPHTIWNRFFKPWKVK